MRYHRLGSICILLLMSAANALAIQTTTEWLSPTPQDLQDLDHTYYYSWATNWEIPEGHQITGAMLTIRNINNWQQEANQLYIHLFDTAPTLSTVISSNVTRGVDSEGGGDNFAGQGILLTTYTDSNGMPGPAENWSYTFSASQLATLIDFAADGIWGLGFDPDCHYYNDRIKLYLETALVPEPATLGLTFCGIGLAAGMRRLRRRKIRAIAH